MNPHTVFFSTISRASLKSFLKSKNAKAGGETQVGTDFVQVTTLVALTHSSSREENLRPFTSSEMTQCSVVERTWAWMPDRPGFESELCTH